MSDTLKAALIGLVASAILAPIITYLIARYWGGRPHLRATLYVHDISIPTFLKTYLKKDLYTGSIIQPDIKKLDILSSLRSYMQLTLHNHGKEKIEAITVTLIGDHPSKYLFQVDTQPELLRPNGDKVVIGNLQPDRSLILHIWSESIVENWHYPTVKNLFKVTADKLYKRTFRFPLPLYLRDKIGQLVFTSLAIFVPLILLNSLYWLYKIYITQEDAIHWFNYFAGPIRRG
jgi:hypothetical protein